MLLRRAVALALTATSALAQPSVGVCVVSTGRDVHSANSTEGLGRVATLFASLNDQAVRRCLISDFRSRAATAAATLRRVDANAVVDDWFDVKTPAELRAAEPELIEQYEGMSILAMVAQAPKTRPPRQGPARAGRRGAEVWGRRGIACDV